MARPLTTRPPSKRARVIPASHFRAECGTLERAVRQMEAATDAELTPYRPGGAENPPTDAFGWLSYYRHLHRLHAQSVGRRVPVSPTLGAAHAAEEEIVLGALREDALAVTLRHPPPDGPEVLQVHVLSEQALRHLDARDDLLRCLARHARALQGSERPEDHALRLEVVEEISYQQAACAWICTSDEWPRLPFDPIATPRPEPPAALRALHPEDLVRVQAAHHRLNAVALVVTRQLVSLPDEKGDEQGGSWRTFFATLEKETNHTIPAATFMRNRSLVSLLASRIIATDAENDAYEKARERAEEEAKHRGRR